MRDLILLFLICFYSVFLMVFFLDVLVNSNMFTTLFEYITFKELIAINFILGYIISIVLESFKIYQKLLDYYDVSRQFAAILIHMVIYTLIPAGAIIVALYVLYYSRVKLITFFKNKGQRV